MMIRELGYNVSSFGSVASVMEMINGAESDDVYNVAIIDLSLPGAIEGQEIFSHLKRKFPGITGVLCTGYFGDRVENTCRDYGFSTVLKKPYNLHDLKRVLGDLIPLKQSRNT